MPIVDYVEIIDRLLVESNRNVEKNKNPEMFDMYSGFVTTENLGVAKYHMLLYKNRLIVHTLYPHTKKKNKKKVIDYVRGKPKG